MPRCWISIGSNLRREPSLRAARRGLEEAFGAPILSSVYESAAVGGGPPFLNLVAGIVTEMSVAHIELRLRCIETANGRLRGADSFAPRTLDLDLLTYGDRVGVIDDRKLPRDEILRYSFVLAPLAEIAPFERHPRVRQSYARLWADFKAEPSVRHYPFDWTAS